MTCFPTVSRGKKWPNNNTGPKNVLTLENAGKHFSSPEKGFLSKFKLNLLEKKLNYAKIDFS
jgi:hypothetical protein